MTYYEIMERLQKLPDKDLLARLIFGEARGETTEGKVAVANVVINRIKSRKPHYGASGGSLTGVALKAWQFSCFNKDDPNLSLLADPPNDLLFQQCFTIAGLALLGLLVDNTYGSTLYYNPQVAAPKWAETTVFKCRIGRHVFHME